MKKMMSLLLCAVLLLSMTAMAFAEDVENKTVADPEPTQGVESTEPGGEDTDQPGEDPEPAEPGESPAPETPAEPSAPSEDSGKQEQGKAAAPAAAPIKVPYVNEKGEDQTSVDAEPVEDSADPVTWDKEWYVVSKDAKIGGKITVIGKVNLILADGAELTASGGITIEKDASLTVWGQTGGTGKLTVTGASSTNNAEAAISGEGTLTICGGTISATGGKATDVENVAASGMDAGTVTVKGGVVTARAVDENTPAIAKVPDLTGYLHVTCGGTAETTVPVEWTTNEQGIADWEAWAWVKIQPMTLVLSLSPDAQTVDLTGLDKTVAFEATMYGVWEGGESVDVVPEELSWSIEPNGPSTITANGLLTVSANEPADKIVVTVNGKREGESAAPASATVTIRHFYTVYFQPRNDEKTIEVGPVLSGSKITPPADPVREGYIFGGWYRDENFAESSKFNFSEETITGNLTLYAKWTLESSTPTPAPTPEQKLFKITFDANGGTCVVVSSYTQTDGKLKSLPSATKSGLYFAGWFTAADGGTKITTSTEFKADTTVYAHWSTAPVTGDENNITLWAVLLGVSALAVIAGGVYIFRKSKKKDQ